MKPQVVVVGSFVQDLTWRCADFPRAGETVIGQFLAGPGGKGSNQAIAAGRAGATTLFIGAVGDDVFGREAATFYKSEGIAARLAKKPAHATGTAAILVNAAGQNEIVVALGANAQLGRRDVEAKLFAGSRIVVCQLESNLATTAHVLKTARKAGVTTLLNPAPMRSDFDRRLLRDVDILIPNETEFTALANLPGVRAAGDVLTEAALARLTPEELHVLCRALGVPTVIVTLGSRGCLISQPHGATFIPAHTGIQVVDTTGAGDAFVGGFAAGFIHHEGDVLAAAHLGNTVAALSVTKRGTAPSMPTMREITRFLRARPVSRPTRSRREGP